ncbi:MAG TPA: hypothetical protein VFI95_08675, partial [Terriglobales bacterium]|nr:hypothetical protein [Terriglobales bacterium]
QRSGRFRLQPILTSLTSAGGSSPGALFFTTSRSHDPRELTWSTPACSPSHSRSLFRCVRAHHTP